MFYKEKHILLENYGWIKFLLTNDRDLRLTQVLYEPSRVILPIFRGRFLKSLMLHILAPVAFTTTLKCIPTNMYKHATYKIKYSQIW